jgi:hypothetical protein
MNKVITSFAAGELFTDLLNIALPSFYKYSIKYNYDLFIPTHIQVIDICKNYGGDHDRPISWLKVPIIRYLLEKYDLVQWIDSDVVINKFDKDINAEFQNNHCIQSFVVHHDITEGNIPNCGIWALKKSAIPLLIDIWNQTDFIHHKWWEQGANIKLMQDNGNYVKYSNILPYEFNVHKNDIRFNERDWENDGIMLHATMWPDRTNKMKEWTARKI